MFIPARLSDYLQAHDARYEICLHRPAHGSSATARTAHVPLRQLAKAVLLEDDSGVLMAVVCADRYVGLGRLSQWLGRQRLRLADEERMAELLPDCERGAVPALGMAWGLETVIDSELDRLELVYVECGDHQRLLRLGQAQFQALTRQARRGPFSDLRIH